VAFAAARQAAVAFALCGELSDDLRSVMAGREFGVVAALSASLERVFM